MQWQNQRSVSCRCQYRVAWLLVSRCSTVSITLRSCQYPVVWLLLSCCAAVSIMLRGSWCHLVLMLVSCCAAVGIMLSPKIILALLFEVNS